PNVPPARPRASGHHHRLSDRQAGARRLTGRWATNTVRAAGRRRGRAPAEDETLAQPKKAALAAVQSARAWPFEEARRIVKRLENRRDGGKKPVVFETGYGPSGLPHIGTFGEVARTSMVRHAFEVLTEGRRKTRLVCFSDDMDGLRKVPDNVPNRELLAAHIGKPLTSVPDPFGNEYPSFAAHNNARLRRFLDRFGFDYEFLSATECYTAGVFDASLIRMLEAYDEVMEIILPTLTPAPLLAIPSHPAGLGQGAAGPDARTRPEEWHHRLRGSRQRTQGRDARDGRSRQVPVEGRLGYALDGARGRLRNVRQGPDRLE